MLREVRRKGRGATHRECRCSSLRVRGWWMLTINSHGVEISIAGCIEEMVRDPNTMPFLFYFILFYFIFYHVLCIIQLLGTNTTCSASYGKAKTPSPIFLQPGTREKAINPSLSGTRPTAHQPRKIRNPPPTRWSKGKIQINTWEGTNRKTLAVDTNKINDCYNH